jgi:hypothetical protein
MSKVEVGRMSEAYLLSLAPGCHPDILQAVPSLLATLVSDLFAPVHGTGLLAVRDTIGDSRPVRDSAVMSNKLCPLQGDFCIV